MSEIMQKLLDKRIAEKRKTLALRMISKQKYNDADLAEMYELPIEEIRQLRQSSDL